MNRVLPILFNTDMVRAILDGRKTVTRRLAKKVPVETHRIEEIEIFQPFYGDTEKQFECHWGGYQPDTGGFVDGSCKVKPPYQIGDVLYVKEKFEVIEKELPESYDTEEMILPAVRDFYPYGNHVKYIPSIFMKKSMARIFLKVTDVRAERVRDITPDQALKEGTEYACNEKCKSYMWCDNPCKGGCECFYKLWNTTIKKADLNRFGMSANPWVWVIEFERCEKPECEVRDE